MLRKKILLLIIFMTNLVSFAVERNKILIYSDEGSSLSGVRQIKWSLEESLKNNYLIRNVLSDDIKKNNWLYNTKLLIFPGGRDKPYHRKLSPLGNEKIREFVEKGGSYLGICAGSYYAGNKVEFALEDLEYRVSEYRDLGFFPGVVRGPVYSGFSYGLSDGVRAVKLVFVDLNSLNVKNFTKIYYNGGGYFVGAQDKTDVSIIANYPGLEKKAAIIEIPVGQGRVILSAVHFEHNPFTVYSRDKHLLKVNAELKNYEKERKKLFKYILNRLNI